MAQVFRGKFLDALRGQYEAGSLDLGGTCQDLQRPVAFGRWLKRLYRKPWVVYAKRPFGGPAQVYRYLGHYTHRVGISNHRLQAMDEHGVRFATRNGNVVTLDPLEFIRRFLLHVLPRSFVKIRHYGLLASAGNTKLERARELLPPPAAADPGADLRNHHAHRRRDLGRAQRSRRRTLSSVQARPARSDPACSRAVACPSLSLEEDP